LAAKQQEQAAKLPDQVTAQDADKVLMLSDKETITDGNDDIDIELASAFRDISIKSKSSKIPSPKMTPTKNVMFNSGASLGQSTTDTMPSSTEDHAASSDDSDPALSVFDFRRQWGTQSCPHIILARPSHPEHNSPFDIHSFTGIKYNDYEYKGFHIRISIALPDMNAWKAFIPTSKEFPNLAPLIGRAVMVKGPSRSYWMSNAGMYNQQKGGCQITKNALEKTDAVIKADPSRQMSFYLIVFPKGIILDNYIFSGKDSDLEMWKHGMKLGLTMLGILSRRSRWVFSVCACGEGLESPEEPPFAMAKPKNMPTTCLTSLFMTMTSLSSLFMTTNSLTTSLTSLFD
jgi:hypothetical protein